LERGGQQAAPAAERLRARRHPRIAVWGGSPRMHAGLRAGEGARSVMASRPEAPSRRAGEAGLGCRAAGPRGHMLQERARASIDGRAVAAARLLQGARCRVAKADARASMMLAVMCTSAGEREKAGAYRSYRLSLRSCGRGQPHAHCSCGAPFPAARPRRTLTECICAADTPMHPPPHRYLLLPPRGVLTAAPRPAQNSTAPQQSTCHGPTPAHGSRHTLQ